MKTKLISTILLSLILCGCTPKNSDNTTPGDGGGSASDAYKFNNYFHWEDGKEDEKVRHTFLPNVEDDIYCSEPDIKTYIKECSVCHHKIQLYEAPESIYTFKLNEDLVSYTLFKFNSKNTAPFVNLFRIPSEYNGLPVTSIGDSDPDCSVYFSSENHNFNELIIPDSITTIRGHVILDNFDSYHFGKNVHDFGEYPSHIFRRNYYVKNYADGKPFMNIDEENEHLKIRDNFVLLDNKIIYYLEDNYEFSNFIFPEYATDMAEWVFEECTLKSITFHKNIKPHSSMINLINVSRSLTVKYEGTLTDWLSLEYVPSIHSISWSGDLDYRLYIDGKRIAGDLTIPEGTEVIPFGAFSYCFDLKSVTFPDETRKIMPNAFSGCYELEELYNFPKDVEMPWGAFNGCISLQTKLEIDNFNNTEEYDYIGNGWMDMSFETGIWNFGYCNALTEITINAGRIGQQVFNYCDNLSKVTLGTGVRQIGNNTFIGCSKLTSIHYKGTTEEWLGNIESEFMYIDPTLKTNGVSVVHCFNGDIEL